MLVSFSFSNFRSVAGEQTLSFVASKRFQDGHQGHAVQIPSSDERVLRVGVLYGANGAGKSNVFKAMAYVESMVTGSRSKSGGTAREPFRFCAKDRDSASSFDLQFVVAEKLYRFGFVVNDERVLEEWLSYEVNGKETILYERGINAKGKAIIEAAASFKKLNEKLAALVTIGGPQNQTFLATIRTTLDEADYGEELGAILGWFASGLVLIAPTTPFVLLNELLSQDQEFLKFAGEFLRAASTGVHALVPSRRELTETEARGLLPEDVFERLNDETGPGESKIARSRRGTEVILDRSAQASYYLRTVQAEHPDAEGNKVSLDLSEESDGTRRLLDLMPALYALRTTDAVFFIDEIDRSMHPLLVWKFIEFFLGNCGSAKSQIIVTTHESNLLDLELLRRDEIWFVEKDPAGATKLYSLADFNVRKDLEIRKHYLQGRFGAIPFLGDLDRLISKQEAARQTSA